MKQTRFSYMSILLALLSMLLANCNKDGEIPEDIHSQQNKSDSHYNGIQSCMEIGLTNASILDTNSLIESRSTALESKLWQVGQAIRVRFIGGSEFVRNKVREYARQWERHANIRLLFIETGEAEIRISFEAGGSWSYIGSDAILIPQNQATMNFGWFTENTSDEEFRRTTVHEFGHALGLVHEHQHPKNHISWDKEAVYNYYSNWTKEQVDRNIFNRYSESQTQFCNYDRFSIMHYSIPRSLTTNGYKVGWNTSLSDHDKWFINRMYPFSGARTDVNCNEVCHHYEGVECYVFDSQAALTVPLYRFYNNQNHDHFYTTSDRERDKVLNDYPDYIYEGIECFVFDNQINGTLPVHRFYNATNGDHFYTIDQEAIDLIATHIPTYRYEGIAFYANDHETANTVPLFRFYNNGSGDHFYTTSEEEKFRVLQDCRE